MVKEKINIENIDERLFEMKMVESENSQPASFTHYIHNHKHGFSQSYKKDALVFVKGILTKEYPTFASNLKYYYIEK